MRGSSLSANLELSYPNQTCESSPVVFRVVSRAQIHDEGFVKLGFLGISILAYDVRKVKFLRGERRKMREHRSVGRSVPGTKVSKERRG